MLEIEFLLIIQILNWAAKSEDVELRTLDFNIVVLNTFRNKAYIENIFNGVE